MSTEKIKLPSQHQMDDPVYFNFGSLRLPAKVIGVHFYPGKVHYDLMVFSTGEDAAFLPMENIDSVHVVKPIVPLPVPTYTLS